MSDDQNAKYFHDGWMAALREAILLDDAGQDPLAWARDQIKSRLVTIAGWRAPSEQVYEIAGAEIPSEPIELP